MFELLIIFTFTLGAIIGSFLNVVTLRYGTGRTVKGRSACFSCGKTLSALELIPVLSFLFLSGKCRNCKSKISRQYLYVEILTGLVFVAVFLKFFDNLYTLPFFTLTYYFTLFSILIVIAVYDLKHFIIPDKLALWFALISLFGLLCSKSAEYLFSYPGLFDLFSGLILFVPFYLLWRLSEGRLIGLGDGKLAIGIGWMLGFAGGTSAIVLGFWIGAVFAICLMFVSFVFKYKKIGLKTEVPFAPFMILGTLIAFLFEMDILNLKFLLGFF